NALLQDLPALGLLVVEKTASIDRLVKLTICRVNTNLTEERVQTECSGLVGNDRNHPLAHLLVADQFGQKTREHHRGGSLTLGHSPFELLVNGLRRKLESDGHFRSTCRDAPPQLTATLQHVFNLRAIHPGMIEGGLFEGIVLDRQVELVAEGSQLIEPRLPH